MIKTFADKFSKSLFESGKSNRFPPTIIQRALRKLDYVNLATRLDDLKIPPGNKLHSLSGNREGQHAIAINNQWRICFRFEDGNTFDVEVCDYH